MKFEIPIEEKFRPDSIVQQTVASRRLVWSEIGRIESWDVMVRGDEGTLKVRFSIFVNRFPTFSLSFLPVRLRDGGLQTR